MRDRTSFPAGAALGRLVTPPCPARRRVAARAAGRGGRQLPISHRHPELADVFGPDRVPNESVIPRTWRNRFDDDVRGYITASAHCLVEEIHNEDLPVPKVRPLEEVTRSSDENSEPTEDAVESFDEGIYRTTQLAREHGFGPFDVLKRSRPVSSGRFDWSVTEC